MEGALYYGDNLDVLRDMQEASVDLIYLDPPFNSQRNFNLVFKERSTSGPKQAFKDVWTWDNAAERAYRQLLDPAWSPPALRQIVGALYQYFGPDRRNDMAYPVMMAVRIIELHRVLKPDGSLYLHCDPTASHHLRLILDAIFGPDRFVNEIIWKRTNVHSDAKRWSPVSDTILFYAKGERFTWNPLYAPHDEEYVREKYRHADIDGRRYMLDNMTSPNPRPNMTYVWKGHEPPPNGWRYSLDTMTKLDKEGRIWYPDSKSKRPRLKRYLDEMSGTMFANVWTDIPPINSQAAERIGYPTQKPVALLERIISASSNQGDVVLDPFCGCGTTIEACIRLHRHWIGIDIADAAVDIIRERLERVFPGLKYKEIGIPADVDSAKRLAKTKPYDFQWWALRKIGARPVKRTAGGKGKKGGDRGIDGELFVEDYQTEDRHRVIISVKAGENLSPGMVRDLIGTVENEKAQMGILVSMHEPTKGMRTTARDAGTVTSTVPGHHDPVQRIQIVTIADIFERRMPILTGRNVTASVQRPGESLPLPGIPEAHVFRSKVPVEEEATVEVAKIIPMTSLAQKPRKPARGKGSGQEQEATSAPRPKK